jgi:hypothetical protein
MTEGHLRPDHNSTAADVADGLKQFKEGISDAVAEKAWEMAEDAARVLLKAGKPALAGSFMQRRAIALTHIVNDEKFPEFKPLLASIESEITLALKGDSSPEKVQARIDDAKAKGLPVEAIRAILPPKVSVQGEQAPRHI